MKIVTTGEYYFYYCITFCFWKFEVKSQVKEIKTSFFLHPFHFAPYRIEDWINLKYKFYNVEKENLNFIVILFGAYFTLNVSLFKTCEKEKASRDKNHSTRILLCNSHKSHLFEEATRWKREKIFISYYALKEGRERGKENCSLKPAIGVVEPMAMDRGRRMKIGIKLFLLKSFNRTFSSCDYIVSASHCHFCCQQKIFVSLKCHASVVRGKFYHSFPIFVYHFNLASSVCSNCLACQCRYVLCHAHSRQFNTFRENPETTAEHHPF